MPYMKDGKRDYKREYDLYHSRPEQRKKRAKRVAARRKMEAAGKVKKGDGKDVNHKKSLKSGGTNSSRNLSITSKKANRSHHINKATKGSQRPKGSPPKRGKKKQ